MGAQKLFENHTALFADFIAFEQNIRALADKMKLDLSCFEIDHLSVRVNTVQSAKFWLTLLLKCGKILSDNIVNGRVIYLIQLDTPLLFLGRAVDVVELPFPKDKCYPQETWEHIEVVMPFLVGENSQQWQQRIENLFLWNQMDELKIKVSEPKVEGEQLPNPSIAVSFRDKTQNHTCIKVHPYSIKKIIEVNEQ